jgi:hypothetical protein
MTLKPGMPYFFSTHQSLEYGSSGFSMWGGSGKKILICIFEIMCGEWIT